MDQNEAIYSILSNLLKHQIDHGDTKDQIKEKNKAFAEKYKMNDEVYDLWIDYCIKEKKIIPVIEFMDNCKDIINGREISESKKHKIIEWLIELMKKDR